MLRKIGLPFVLILAVLLVISGILFALGSILRDAFERDAS
jgi:CHASE3 domain sensor protein